jgi:hypothetical protein
MDGKPLADVTPSAMPERLFCVQVILGRAAA